MIDALALGAPPEPKEVKGRPRTNEIIDAPAPGGPPEPIKAKNKSEIKDSKKKKVFAAPIVAVILACLILLAPACVALGWPQRPSGVARESQIGKESHFGSKEIGAKKEVRKIIDQIEETLDVSALGRPSSPSQPKATVKSR